MSRTESASTIIGRNAKALRIAAGATAEDVAREVRNLGLNWGTARVSALESGQVAPSLPTVFALVHALTTITGSTVTVPMLLNSDAYVEVGSVGIRSSTFGEVFNGTPRTLRVKDFADASERIKRAHSQFDKNRADIAALPERLQSIDLGKFATVEAAAGDAERKLASSLGVPKSHVLAAITYLWDGPFIDERDRRAGPDANAQRRGIVSRSMKSEIEGVLHGDD